MVSKISSRPTNEDFFREEHEKFLVRLRWEKLGTRFFLLLFKSRLEFLFVLFEGQREFQVTDGSVAMYHFPDPIMFERFFRITGDLHVFVYNKRALPQGIEREHQS